MFLYLMRFCNIFVAHVRYLCLCLIYVAHRYRPEIPEPAPSLPRHGAKIWGIRVFPAIKITVIRQVRMNCGASVKIKVLCDFGPIIWSWNIWSRAIWSWTIRTLWSWTIYSLEEYSKSNMLQTIFEINTGPEAYSKHTPGATLI